MMATSTRLHITPLTPDIISSVLPTSIQLHASDISFHTIPTFPESGYGYVTLPAVEAEKFRKKMDGSMLKGNRFKVEAARPQKRPADGFVEDLKPVSSRPPKRQKVENGVLKGYELTDRQIKRGWTESLENKQRRRKEEKRKGKDARAGKAQSKSKYTGKPECLFRTRIPLNRLSASHIEEEQCKKEKKASNTPLVHEFSKTATYPTFVRLSVEETVVSAAFEDGKGWVDSSGGLKEPVCDRIRSDRFVPGRAINANGIQKTLKIASGEKLRSPVPNREGRAPPGGPAPESTEGSDGLDDWTTSSAESSSDNSRDTDSDTSNPPGDSTSTSSGGSRELNQSRRAAECTPSAEPIREAAGQPSAESYEHVPIDIHPLEALYKRSAAGSAEDSQSLKVNTRFSFFANSDIESDDEGRVPEIPYTPYTQRSMESRELGIGVPTPDTRMAPRHMLLSESENDRNGGLYTSTPAIVSVPGPDKEESGFAKWFWENRGDNNRAWKKRRRDAAKEERQRENRRKGAKGKS